ncbi:MAG: tRNA uridine-5-carboxymethylaminomethyl(34) synthesis GTPase MnmE [Firmicutes bacterium]|nr:tRNA uridine-5-carboxymethylaminomethyl(34) synthesis GTPase MnmE [Bacillota bacterium]
MAKNESNISPDKNSPGELIAAIATPPGTGGIAVVRLSGEGAIEAADKIFRGAKRLSEKESHTISYGRILDPDTGEALDEVLVSVMRAPKSYTREDVIEINCHGGIFVAKRILGAVLKAGARVAEPGEFTKRAFLNGRLELSQAEAVIDIINAKTELQRRAGLGRLSGALGSELSSVRGKLLDVLALIAAAIDYPDEMADEEREVLPLIRELCGKMENFLHAAARGRLIREGVSVVILGKPNVGKSSLLNRILDAERALVTDIPGTTRDFLEEYYDLDGLLVRFVDTAGLRDEAEKIEKMGIERGLSQAKDADVVILVFDSAEKLSADDTGAIERVKELALPTLCVLNKSDLPQKLFEEELSKLLPDCKTLRISAAKDTELTELFSQLKELIFGSGANALSDEPFSGGARHEDALRRAKEALQNAAEALELGLPQDMAAIDLKNALFALGGITGENAPDELINRIFELFCVGK